jgi:DNA-directed RNA polymerase II subunit RPB2
VLLLLPQVAACQGSEGDATPFTDVKVDDVSEELHKRGYQRYGWEVRDICRLPAGSAATVE